MNGNQIQGFSIITNKCDSKIKTNVFQITSNNEKVHLTLDH